MALVSQSDIEARIGRSLTATEASAFTGIRDAIESHVKSVIGSDIENVSPVTRYYDGGIMNLPIDPCTNITAVKIVDENYDDIETLTDDLYALAPINSTIKQMVRYRPGRTPRGLNNISVTAKFSIYGDSDVLAVVKDAIISAIESEIGNEEGIKSESIEGYSVTYMDSATKDILKPINYLFPRII